MAKKTTPLKQSSTQLVDFVALLAAVFYMQSVLTVAHHISMWPLDGIARKAESPAVFLLVVGLALCAYSIYKRRNAAIPVVIALTVFVTASLFWLSGLRTNFYL